METSVDVGVEGRRLRLSNLDKVLYPARGFTKAQVIDYYTRVAPALLPHLGGRALTLKRYPDGVESESFYEKQCPSHRPDWVRTAPVPVERGGREIDHCLAGDLPTLVWLANLAAIELHVPLSLAADSERPTALVLDLDPGPPATIVECAQVAVRLRDALGELGLESFPKASGLKGLQVYLPLNASASYEETKPFARALAEVLERRHPQLVLSAMARSRRPGKVLIDWSQNDARKTTVCAYSLRAGDLPTVSTPVSWDEVEEALESGDGDLLAFDPGGVLERVAAHGDLFAPVLALEQRLPRL